MTFIRGLVFLVVAAVVCFVAVSARLLLRFGQSDAELVDICNFAPQFAPDDQKCSVCIRRHPKCAWCSKPGAQDDANTFRCNLRERHEQSCPPQHIVSPQSRVEIIRDEPLSNAGVNEKFAVQIAPQEYRMRLRPNETTQIKIRFRQAVDYPLDLYYLMDMSYSMSDGINLDFSAICKNGVVNMSNACGGVQLGDTITFNVNVTVVNCDSPKREFKFSINPAGLSENVSITLTKLCDCDCAKIGGPGYVVRSKECSYRGDLVCGLCKCPPPYAGPNCECDISTTPGKTRAELDLMCRPGNDSNAPLCSGRGTCVCGRCVCNKLLDERQFIYGKYCECDNYSCPRADGNVCGGHGTCGCDQQCTCEEGWTGRDCSCPTSTVTCLASNGKVCNGKGHCVCGVCNCFDDIYSGPTCEQCPTCPTPCVRFRDCVLYKAFNRRPMNQSEFEIRCQGTFIIVKELPDVYQPAYVIHHETCQFVDAEDECTYYFKLAISEDGLEDGNVTLLIREDKDCPPLLPVLSIILGQKREKKQNSSSSTEGANNEDHNGANSGNAPTTQDESNAGNETRR